MHITHSMCKSTGTDAVHTNSVWPCMSYPMLRSKMQLHIAAHTSSMPNRYLGIGIYI